MFCSSLLKTKVAPAMVSTLIQTCSFASTQMREVTFCSFCSPAPRTDCASVGMTGLVWRFHLELDGGGENCRSLHYATPDFLSTLVGSTSFMRLSLRKAAHAALSTAA
jgi:hypothetical protein